MFLVLNSLLLLCTVFSFAYKTIKSQALIGYSIVVGSYSYVYTLPAGGWYVSVSSGAIIMPLKGMNNPGWQRACV